MPSDIIIDTDKHKKNEGKFLGKNGAPPPRGGGRGEIGEYIYDPDCRLKTENHEQDCKDIFGEEWGWGSSSSNLNPYGWEDWAGLHHSCPPGGAFHKCIRKRHTGSKYDCCVAGTHKRNKMTSSSPSCKPEWRGAGSPECYNSLRSYCGPQATQIETDVRAYTDTCKGFCEGMGIGNDRCHQMWKQICHTNNPHDLKKRIKDPDCYKNFWAYTNPDGNGNYPFTVSLTGDKSFKDINVKNIKDKEQENYCFKTVNGKYVNIDKNFEDLGETDQNLNQLQDIFDCRYLCTDNTADGVVLASVNNGNSFKKKCERAWKNKCKELEFDKFGSSNVIKNEETGTEIDYTELCPIFWDKEDIKLTKAGELIDNAKHQKPDKCSFAALTQTAWKENVQKEPVCWYPELNDNDLKENVVPGLSKGSPLCIQNKYFVCCQSLKLGDNVSSPSVNIKQNCTLPELENPNTITTFDGYALRVPWLAPPFEPDSKCKDTPVPTGVVCTEPDPYQEFEGFLDDVITFSPDEVRAELMENWERKLREEQEWKDSITERIMKEREDRIEREPTSPPKEKSWWEIFIEWIRKIFGFGKKKTVDELREETNKKLEEEEKEEFTNISKKNSIFFIILFVLLIISFKIKK